MVEVIWVDHLPYWAQGSGTGPLLVSQTHKIVQLWDWSFWASLLAWTVLLEDCWPIITIHPSVYPTHKALQSSKQASDWSQQGCISCLTCSYPELTKDHVLTSAYVNIFRTVTRNAVNKSVWRKKDCFWLPLNKHAMNIWLSSLKIRAHLSWRTGKHLHVLHVLRTYPTCSYPGYQDTTTYAALGWEGRGQPGADIHKIPNTGFNAHMQPAILTRRDAGSARLSGITMQLKIIKKIYDVPKYLIDFSHTHYHNL